MTPYTLARPTQSKISRLRELLGPDAVLLPCSGKRPTVPSWQKLTAEMMNDATYLKRLNDAPNIGVALGDVSNGLVAIDLDRDELVEPFLSVNPSLRDTLQTHGARGRAIWVRCEGDCPQRTVKLKTRLGLEAGEIRSNGSQQIISGLHPDTNNPYEFNVKRPPMSIEWSSIQWPSVFLVPTPLMSSQAITSVISVNSVDSVTLSSLSLSVTPSLPKLNEAQILKRCIATDVHSSHKRLFDLARGVLTLERAGGKLPQGQLESLFGRWYDASLPNLRPNQCKAAYFMEFLNACDCAEHGLDESPLMLAWEQSKKSSPPEAANFKSPQIAALVSLCWQLQLHAGEKEFFLSCRSAGALLETNHVQAWRFLLLLVKKGVLKVVKAGGPDTNLAHRYRFIQNQKSKVIKV